MTKPNCMASYSYDPYEPLHSRHYDSSLNDRTRHDSRHLDRLGRRSAASSDEMNGRLHPDHCSRYDYHDSRPDSRYSYPSLPSRSKSRRGRSASRHGRQWPPPPTVEEEKAALAKEFGHVQSTRDDEAPSRGSIDQDPIILEVPEYIHDRRFVLVPSDGKTHPTPPTSDDEKNKRGRKKAPKLETKTLPEMRRESSPYAWTKPTAAPSKRASGDLFLSPDAITPSATYNLASASRSTPSSATPILAMSASSAHPSRDRSPYPGSRREARANRKPSPQAQTGANSSEDDVGRRKIGHTRRRLSNRTSDVNSENDRIALLSTRENAAARHASRQPRDSSPTTSHDRLSDRDTKPAPLKAASLHRPRHVSETRPSLDPYDSPPRSSSSRYPPSPPRSPRPNSDRSRDAPPSSSTLPNSRPGSRHASLQSSPLHSPHLSKSSLTSDALWGSFAAAGAAGGVVATAAGVASAAHQPRQASRLSASTMTELPPAPRSVPSNYPPTHVGSSLPYPVEETMFQLMPSERDHIYISPDQRSTPRSASGESSKPASRTATPTTSSPIPISRPLLSTRNSAAQDFPVSPKSPSYPRPLSSAGATSKPKTPSQLKALARPLPPCPRQGYTSRYDDWYSLDGCPSFDICPDCLERVFGDTTFRPYFKPSPSRALIGKGLQVRCDFGDAWVRLGWLLTVQRELPSLDLIKTLVNGSPPSDSDEACPGAVEAVRNWYSIRDRDGHFLRGFAVCSADVRRLQVLFPGFRELWQPLPMRASYSYGDDFGGLMRACSLRPALNNRFPQYIDTLVRLHESSYQAGRMPDVSEFVSLVRRKTLVHECTRDDMVREQAWHFIPSLLPAFTVCEDCYNEVVLPAVHADADVAMRFNREAQPIYNEGSLGSSCQLYSPRMRRVFDRAVKDNDLKYLARRATDRKKTEERLQDRVAEIRRLARRVKRSSGGYALSAQASSELSRLDDEMNDLTDEWTRWE